MKIEKLPSDATQDFKDGFVLGLNNMLAMVLTVFDEHKDYTKEQIEQYIKDNL